MTSASHTSFSYESVFALFAVSLVTVLAIKAFHQTLVPLANDEMLYAKFGVMGPSKSASSWRNWSPMARRRYLRHVRSHIARPEEGREWLRAGRNLVNVKKVIGILQPGMA
jgi:hypothetical protein